MMTSTCDFLLYLFIIIFPDSWKNMYNFYFSEKFLYLTVWRNCKDYTYFSFTSKWLFQ